MCNSTYHFILFTRAYNHTINGKNNRQMLERLRSGKGQKGTFHEVEHRGTASDGSACKSTSRALCFGGS